MGLRAPKCKPLCIPGSGLGRRVVRWPFEYQQLLVVFVGEIAGIDVTGTAERM